MRVSRYSLYEWIVFHIYLLVFWITFDRKNEWWATGILFLIVAVLLVIEYLRTGQFISPLFFWYAFWLGAISIGRMRLGIEVYPLYQDWSVRLMRIVLLNTAVFFYMYWLGEFCRGILFAGDSRVFSDSCNGELLADGVILALAVAVVAFVCNVLKTGVIPQLTGDANSYRTVFILTRFYQIVSVLRFILAVVPVAVKVTRSGRKKLAIVVLTVLFLVEEMLTGWRAYTLQGLILLLTSYLVVYEDDSAKGRKRSLIIFASFAALAAAFIVYITVTRDGGFESVSTRVQYAVNNFYLYVAPNFLNFQTVVDKVNPKGYLMYTLEAFWSLVVPRGVNPEYIWLDMEQSIGAYNVCTYLLEPYADLGTAGTCLWTGIIALLSGCVFENCRRRKSVSGVVCLGIVNINIFMMHNNFFLRSSSVIVWIILSIIISRITTNRKQDADGEALI